MCKKVTQIWTSGRCDAALRSNRHFVWSILTPWGGNHRPLPGITEPAGQVWLTWHCSLDSCCDCQHTKSLAVLSSSLSEWHLTHLSQNLLTGSVPGSVFASPSGRLVGRDAKALNCASICMRCIFIHPEIWSFYPKHCCECLIHNFITLYKIWLNDMSRCLWPCRNLLVLLESFGVFISYTGVQVAALIFPLTCYMWQQEPSQISDRLCVLCFRRINTCSVCLTAVFVWAFTNKLN